MQQNEDQKQSAPTSVPSENRALVTIDNAFLSRDTGEPIFRNLTFCLTEGESVVLLGGAGSGKTSLLELLVGLRFANGGSVELFGRQLRRRKWGVVRAIRQKIGGVGGPFGLIPSMTVRENVSLPLIVSGDGSKLLHERLTRTLTELSLLNLAGRYPRQLTRVEATLAQLARATVAGQPLVLIDEPLAGLDKATVERLLDYLTKVSWSGRSLIITSSEPLPVTLPKCRTLQFAEGTLR